MMAQWMSPLHWRDYSTQWNLLFLQHLAQPNKNDPYNQPVGMPVREIIGLGGERWEAMDQLLSDVIRPSEGMVLDDPRWFYTVTGRQPRWFDQRIFLSAPLRLVGTPLSDWFWHHFVPDAYPSRGSRLDPVQLEWAQRERSRGDRLTPDLMSRWLARKVWLIGEGRERAFNPHGHVPSVHTDAGERAVAFTSLARALAFLEANPQKPVWVMAFDAPDYPVRAKVPSENALWFVLTHPDYNTHPFPRKPLAVMYAPQKTDVVPQKSRAEAFKTTIGDALDAAAVKPADIGRFFHDAGTNAPPGTGIGAMAQALTELDPGNEWFSRAYDVDRYLQNAGAAAAAMNFALATAFTHHTGKPALVVATRERDAAYAMVIAPPPEHVVPASRTEWPRARGEGSAYLPWWGALIRR
jgi:hypothetical protein